MMTTLRFHHIGIACKQLASARATHLQLGFCDDGPAFVDPQQKVRGRFMRHGALRVELLEPIAADSPLHPYLRRGVQMYHQAYETVDLQAALLNLEAQGARRCSEPLPAVAFAGRHIVFVMLASQMLVELIESADDPAR